MHVSKEVDFGLRMMMVLAKGQLSAKDLAENYRIPHNFVQLILPKLVRQGLILWVPKTKNIYALSKPAAEITMLDIVTALNGPVDLMGRHYAKAHESDDHFSAMLDVWHELQGEVEQRLAGVTLEKLAGA
jgi:Rrf2 family protein